ncbi:ATPase family AAA domain-containing protein 2-like isoform X2 [Anthonomus grandis grandis]|nr:ATPase family AAA domain-containing protein 2-like isoform X2 [Anthonomus grandis grandis]XP_050294666.1 ATPase family AAA domain-containing protein 2-like isoform X2 [Anthonomus grandis grandis]
MEEEIVENNSFSVGNDYYRRSTLRTRRKENKIRVMRRTALSLRPIHQKSYADHSPIRFDTDSDGVLKRVTRRSMNTTWLTDSQMHKVGYPNLNAGYSEEDSRDAADVHPNVEISQRSSTRPSRRIVKPVYYYEEYDDVPQIRRTRRRVVRPEKIERRDVETSNNRENNEEEGGRIIRTRNKVKQELISEDDESKPSKEDEDENVEEKGEEAVQNSDSKSGSAKDQQENSSVSDEEGEDQQHPLPRTRTRQTRIIRQNMNKNSESDSSDTEEGGRKYSLRDRVPKPAPKTMQTSVLRQEHERRPGRSRRFIRRRRSSSNSSPSSSERCRMPPKSPHSKKEMMKTGAGGSNNLGPINPETLDKSVRFSSIGGLETHIQCLKEMILLPMMYPEVFRKFQVQPPRGVLFHGPPGTGKTLIARALANECSFDTRQVSFFMRKGADLLSKWIGESEKQLRLLFEQAAEKKPSIIFFDELDGLAPVRSSRQDQVHASIVSTLLALMDGLNDRGDVIVIGATNRIDAIDPALRRPGRFDRELFFPLPSKSDRESILKVHVSQWQQPPSQELLGYLAENTVGYCGSDLRALCSEAVIQSFRRTYPQVYGSEYRLLLDPEKVKVEKVDFLRAKSMLVPASHRVTSAVGKKLLPILEPLLGSDVKKALMFLEQSFPHGLNSALSKVKLSGNIRPAQFLLTGNGAHHGQANHIAPALLFKMEHIHSYVLDLATTFKEPGRTAEEACIQVFTEAKRSVPSIIYIPTIDGWWDMVSDTVRAIFLTQVQEIDFNIPILFLATANVLYDDLPDQLQEVFSPHRKEILEIRPPNAETRRLFFKGLLIDTSLKPPRQQRERPKTPPPLPRAPTPPPAPLSEEQAQKIYETEEHTLRELRIFLRDMCKKLANNKLFFMFTKPVDTEEVPDYTEIIKQPMDLETMMMKVDFHRYECAKDFLSDIDLICQNALEYNPAKSSADKQIRHRACSLRDYAYTLIKTEMDSDFEDKCKDIKQKRKKRKACVSKYLPPYIVTPDKHNLGVAQQDDEPSTSDRIQSKLNGERARISPVRKRRVPSWQRGFVKKPKRTKLEGNSSNGNKSKELNSNDESKDPDSSTMEVSSQPECEPEKTAVTTALNIDCDSQKIVSSSYLERSPSQVVTDLLSPSELLGNQLYFDDIDQALNENVSDISKTPAQCSESELEKVLDQTVKHTEGVPLMKLLDLYNEFSTIIRKFSKTHIRTGLPKELTKELIRFKKFLAIDSQNGSQSTPA